MYTVLPEGEIVGRGLARAEGGSAAKPVLFVLKTPYQNPRKQNQTLYFMRREQARALQETFDFRAAAVALRPAPPHV